MTVYDDILAELRAIRGLLEHGAAVREGRPFPGEFCWERGCANFATVRIGGNPWCAVHARVELG